MFLLFGLLFRRCSEKIKLDGHGRDKTETVDRCVLLLGLGVGVVLLSFNGGRLS